MPGWLKTLLGLIVTYLKRRGWVPVDADQTPTTKG